MRFGSVEICQELLDAQANSKLVVFVGAGISMAYGYPSFNSLAKWIADDCWTKDKNEPTEAFLGRLYDSGVKIHQRCCRIIRNHRPSGRKYICKYIIDIVACKNRPRIITTNFDMLLTTAAESQDVKLHEYVAPALPSGDDFTGIVYLHGNIKHEHDGRLVLIDSDFSKAYITEGWARNFLTSVYDQHTVLFIGYSHNDVIMRALARGLSSSARTKYALVPQREYNNEFWKSLCIEPIVYMQSRKNDHRNLHTALEMWSQLSMMKTTDHDARIRRVVATDPNSLTPDDDEYLKYIVSDTYLIHRFVNEVYDPRYLVWACERGLLTGVFSSSTCNERQAILLTWVCRKFAVQHFTEFEQVFRKSEQGFDEHAWYEVFQALNTNKPGSDAVIIRTNLAQILIDRHVNVKQIGYLFGLVITWPYESYRGIIWTVFERASLLSYSLGTSSTEVCTHIQPFYRKMFWTNIVEPNMDELAEPVAELMILRIREAYHTLVGMNRQWRADKPTYRQDIDTDETEHHNYFDVLVDMARDALAWLAINRPLKCTDIIIRLLQSKIPLLIRLGIHIVDTCNIQTSDDKLVLMMVNDLIFDYRYQHENYKLLIRHYHQSSETVRITLCDYIVKGPSTVNEYTLKAQLNLINELYKASNNCPVAEKARMELYTQFLDIQPDDDPLYSKYRRYGAGDITGNTEYMLQLDPVADYGILTTYDDNDSGHLFWILSAASHGWDWAFSLLTEMLKRQNQDDKLWIAVIDGISRVTDDTPHWTELTTFIISNTSSLPIVASLHFLYTIMMKHAEIRECDEVFWQLYSRSGVDSTIPLDTGTWKEWVESQPRGLAIGILIQLTLMTDADCDVHMRYRDELSRLLCSTNIEDQLLISQITPMITDLYDKGPEWTISHVLPILRSHGLSMLYAYRWGCFISQSFCRIPVYKELLPEFVVVFEHLHMMSPDERTYFVKRVASMCCQLDEFPIDKAWLYHFTKSINTDERIEWFRQVSIQLDSNGICADKLWNQWMSGYISGRFDGIPCRFTGDEVIWLLDWILPLKPVFPQVVRAICGNENIPISECPNHLLSSMETWDWSEANIEDLGIFLAWILDNAEGNFWYILHFQDDIVVNLVKIARQHGLSQIYQDRVLKRLYDLGYTNDTLSERLSSS